MCSADRLAASQAGLHVKNRVRLIAVWMGLNAVLFGLFAVFVAFVGGVWRDSWLRPVIALFLLGLAILGAIATLKLWALKMEGRRLAILFFTVLALSYSVKLITGPNRGLVALPFGVCVLALSGLTSARTGSLEWRTGSGDIGA